MRKSEIQKQETEKARVEAEKAIDRLRVTKELEDQSILEEENKVAAVKAEIDAICEREDLFCGIILDAAHIANIVKLAIEKNDTINIKFELYFKKNQ